MLITPGIVLGRYKVRSALGAGGMGEVFLAEDTELGRLVALKVLLAGMGEHGDASRRFVQEAKTVSALNHPNILTVYEIGTVGDSRFIATEYIDGMTLRDRLKIEPPTAGESLDIAIQIAAALDAAHGAGIVHRDIKPENVMLRGDGLVKVLDFGLAKLAEDDTDDVSPEDATLARVQTMPGIVMGTVNYMSPEQARGKDVDTRSDVWSLGVVFYEMLTGRTPFAEDTTNDTIAAILRSEPEPLGEGAPPEVVRIIRKALQKDRNERYQTVRDLMLDLKNLKREVDFAIEIERTQHSADRSTADSFAGWPTGRRQAIDGPAVPTREDVGADKTGEQSAIIPPPRRSPLYAVLGVAALLTVAAVSYFTYFAAGDSINSIAVLPFAAAGGGQESSDLPDSVSEAIINDLSKIAQLKVISRASSFKYRSPDADPQEIAASLGVQALVMGRMVQRGDNVELNVELVNAADRSLIWGESYNRRLADIQSVQDEIAYMISQKLKLDLSGEQQKLIGKQVTSNTQAYQSYLNGVFYGRKRGHENIVIALQHQKRAIELDPQFALAHVELARNYTLLVGSDIVTTSEGKQLARAAVERALVLDPDLPDAHLAYARIQNDNLEWTGAEQSYRRALELNPSLASAHNAYAFQLSCMGRHPEAVAEIKRAQELDPLSTGLKSTEGGILYAAARYDEAIAILQEAVARDPDDTFARAYLGLSYTGKGRYDDALREFDVITAAAGESPSISIYKARALAMSGRRDEAAAILDQLESGGQYVSPGELASLYAALGHTDKAFEALEKAFAARDLQLQFLRVDPAYGPIRSDPRFADLLRRVGLA